MGLIVVFYLTMLAGIGSLTILIDWIASLSCVVLASVFIGLDIKNIPWGILIDEKNKISLSRFQMILWTIIVLSGIITAGFLVVIRELPDLSSLGVPPPIWAAMGIAVTSLVGSPIITGTKMSEEYNGVPSTREIMTAKHIALERGSIQRAIKTKRAELNTFSQRRDELQNQRSQLTDMTRATDIDRSIREVMATITISEAELGRLDRDLELLKDPRFLNLNLGYLHDLGRVYNVGNVLINRDIKDASISDLFRSEEIDNSDKIDLGKVQMFYFTLIIVIIYSILLLQSLMGLKAPIFPPLDQGMAVLLAISNGGYLLKKAA